MVSHYFFKLYVATCPSGSNLKQSHIIEFNQVKLVKSFKRSVVPVDSIFLSFAILIAQKIGSKFVVCPPQRRQQQQQRRMQQQQQQQRRPDYDSDDIFNSDYEDELRGFEDDPSEQQHLTSDINLMYLVEVKWTYTPFYRLYQRFRPFIKVAISIFCVAFD